MNNSNHQERQLSGIPGWIDHRLPVFTFINRHLRDYRTPINLNWLWNTGFLSGVALSVMMITGIFLAMNYTPHIDEAFDSVQRIMREVNYGWLIRYVHMNGSSMLFIVTYLHILRGIYYGSFKKPREILWILGVLILVLMMATSFLGYILPWGQTGYWGATVITNLFSAIPWIGEKIVRWLWGGYSMGNAALNRFYVMHYILPFLMVAVVLLHLVALHRFGSNNPAGIEPQKPEDCIPFHPCHTYRDFFALGIFFMIWAVFVFFAPDFFTETDNYLPADPLVTPTHIKPEWYLLPFYGILRSVPDKLGGIFLMFSGIFILFFLPWLDRSPIKSGRYRPFFRIFYILFLCSCVALGWSGTQPPEGIALILGRVATAWYFFHFLIVLPLILPRWEKTSELPESIHASMRGKNK